MEEYWKGCLGRVSHYKLGSFSVMKKSMEQMNAQVLSWKLSPGFVLGSML
jgi:hypothetical protein